MTKLTVAVDKADFLEEIDFSGLPEVSQQFIIAYGLRQYLNDAVAGVKDDQAKASEKVMLKMKKLIEGTVGTRESSGKSALETVVYRLAHADVTAAIKAKGKKVKDFSEDQLETLVNSLIAKRTDHYEAAAKAEMAAKAARKAKANAQAADLAADLGI